MTSFAGCTQRKGGHAQWKGSGKRLAPKLAQALEAFVDKYNYKWKSSFSALWARTNGCFMA